MVDEDLGRDFRRLLVSAASSNLGDGVRVAAFPLLAVTLTDEPLLISGVAAATFLPAVLFGPLGGVLVDRQPRRRLIVFGQFLRAAATIVFLIALFTDVGGIWAVYALALALGAGEVVVDGAAQAAVPALVPRSLLERANARMISAQTVLDELAGRALGGVLFAVAPVVPFIVDGMTFLVGGAAASRLEDPIRPTSGVEQDGARAADRGRTVLDDVKDGFGFLWGHDLLRLKAVTVGLINLGAATGASVLVIRAVNELGSSEIAFGLLLTAGAVGGLLGSLVAERLVRAVGRPGVLVGSVILMSIGLLVVALAPSVLVVGVGTFVQGIGGATHNVPGRSLRQEVTPDELLGRVITSYRVFGYVGVPAGALVAGLVTDIAGAGAAFITAAVVMAVAAVVMVNTVRYLPERQED